MINLASLMGKITGKSALGQTLPGDATRAGGEAGGDFAALVELAAQAGAGRDQGGLKLVVNNGALPDGKALPGTGETVLPGTDEIALPGTGEMVLPGTGGKALPGSGETGVTGLPRASQTGMPRAGGKALPTTDGAFPSEAANGLSGSAMPTGAQPSPGVPVATTPKIAKASTQVDVAALSAVDTLAVTTPIDPVVTAIGEDGQPMDKDGQPETSAQAQPAEQIAGQINPSAASMQASQAAAAQIAVMQTPSNARATSAPVTSTPTTGEPGQPVSTIASSLPVQASGASGEKPKAEVKTPRNAFALAAAETIGARDSETATTASDIAQSAPTDSPRSRASDGSPIATAATTMISPLRAIVDSLPPVIQSSLAAAPVSAVTGPSTGEMLGDQVIDMGVSGQWIDRMAREITALSEGSGHSRFTLNPPHLGRLEVNLWQGQDGASLRLTAETDEAARRLSEGRPALQADARMAALNLGTITIEKAAPSQDSGRDQGQRQGGDQANQMQQQSGGQGQGPGQNQTRAGNGQQGEWVNRFVRDEPAQQNDAAALSPAQRAARGNVRFA